MQNNMNSPHKGQGKDTDFQAQKRVFYTYLLDNLATASMVEAATGIKQKNICRFKRELEKMGKLWEVVEKRCKITGYNAAYLTTDPNKAPNLPEQLKLFRQ